MVARVEDPARVVRFDPLIGTMAAYLQTRVVTDDIFRDKWLCQVRLYDDVWTTVFDGDVFDCARHANFLNGTTPR